MSLIIDCTEHRETHYITSDKGCFVVEQLIAKLRALPDDLLLGRERSIEYIKIPAHYMSAGNTVEYSP